MRVTDKDVLLAVDVQNDFCPGGALPVQFGDMVVPLINRIIYKFHRVVLSRDWHPQDHCGFADDPQFIDGSWPEHCVQFSPGAEFHGDLIVPTDALIVSKGSDRDKEAYSAFEGDADLGQVFRKWGIERIFVAGIATDYCVLNTALDARKLGLEVVVLTDACRGVDVPEGNIQRAFNEMKNAGVKFATVHELSE